MSVAGNIAFATKVLIFDPNYQFRLICYVNRHAGFLELREPMSERFKERILANPSHSKRLGTDGIVYISWWDWRDAEDWHWNLTRQIVEGIYEEETGKSMTGMLRNKLKTNGCDFIRKYALKRPRVE